MTALVHLKERLESLRQLRELVGALRSMAASRSREAQEGFAGTRAYLGIIEHALINLDFQNSTKVEKRHENGAIVVFTSENGFVGGFNNRIVDRALELKKPDDRLIVVGRRGQVAVLERNVETDTSLPMTSRVAGINKLSRRVVAFLNSADRAQMVFARYESGGTFQVTDREIMPVTLHKRTELLQIPPLHHLAIDRLVEQLQSEYLFAEVAHALMESLASENGARLQTMSAATHNIDDRLQKLSRQATAAWQEQTTMDMLEVVIGGDAARSQ